MADCPGACWFCDYAKSTVERFNEVPNGHAKLRAQLRRERDPECSTARILAESIVNEHFGFQPTGRQVDVDIKTRLGQTIHFDGMDEMYVLTNIFMDNFQNIYGERMYSVTCSNHRPGIGLVQVPGKT